MRAASAPTGCDVRGMRVHKGDRFLDLAPDVINIVISFRAKMRRATVAHVLPYHNHIRAFHAQRITA